MGDIIIYNIMDKVIKNKTININLEELSILKDKSHDNRNNYLIIYLKITIYQTLKICYITMTLIF
jgi:hypothetical protein